MLMFTATRLAWPVTAFACCAVNADRTAAHSAHNCKIMSL
jgi:hypothetical protein